VAVLRAESLQVTQDTERATAEVGELQRPFDAVAFEITDRAITGRACVEQFGQRLVLDHRRSTLIMRSWAGLRFTRASIRTGSPSSARSRKRRVAPFMCSIISWIEKFSPMQCRGPAANGM